MAHINTFVRLRGCELHLLTNGPFPVALLIVTIIMSIVPGFTIIPLTTHTNSRLSLPITGENSTQSGCIGSRAGRKHEHQNNDDSGAGDGNENPKRRRVLKFWELTFWELTFWEVDILGVDNLGRTRYKNRMRKVDMATVCLLL